MCVLTFTIDKKYIIALRFHEKNKIKKHIFVCYKTCCVAGPVCLHHPITAAAATHAGHSTSSVCVCLSTLLCILAVVIEYQIEQKIIPPPPSITEERPSQSRSFL